MNFRLVSRYKNLTPNQKKVSSIILVFIIIGGWLVVQNQFLGSSIIVSIDGKIIQENEKIVHLISKIIKKQLESVIELELTYASNSNLISLVKNGKWESAISLISSSIKTSNNFIDRVGITDNLGILKSNFPQKIEVHNQNFSEMDWFRGVTKHYTPYVSEVYKRAVNPRINVIAVAVPIIEPKLQTLIGILVFQIYLNKFDELIQNINVVAGNSALLIDQHGNIISGHDYDHSKPHEIINQANKPDVKSVITGETGSKIILLDGEYYLSSFTPVLPFGWSVLLRIPYLGFSNSKKL